MSDPVKCLHALAHTLFTCSTYPAGHVARQHALDAWHAATRDLLQQDRHPHFSFLRDDVVYGKVPLRELRGWKWSRRLAAVGVQRLEFDADIGVSIEELEAFVEDVLTRLEGQPVDSSEARQMRVSGVVYGEIAVDGEEIDDSGITTVSVGFSLGEEASAIRWLHEEIARGHGLPLAEAEAVVRMLAVAMHGDQEMLLPLLRLRQFDEYTTTHSLNVSVLTMALAEWLGMGAWDVRAFGVAGLMHDLGKVKIPKEILNKPGKFDDREREIMNTHPTEGARIILSSDQHLDLAAVVAYEHHIMINGGGYPQFTFARDCHSASKLVHVCDVYDALRTKRPYRDAWPAKKVLAYLEERSGVEFDGDLAHAFTEMMTTWEPQVAYVSEQEAIPMETPTNRPPKGE